jgi:hypothetical protein
LVWLFIFSIDASRSEVNEGALAATTEGSRRCVYYFKNELLAHDHQALPCLLNLFTTNHKKSIKKEACSTISNITAGNRDQIQVYPLEILRHARITMLILERKGAMHIGFNVLLLEALL